MKQGLFKAVVSCLWVYMLSLGGTYNGTLSLPHLRYVTLAALGMCVLVWLVTRYVRGWRWMASAFDGVWLLFALAIGASLLANLETWHRSVYGVWFIALGFGIWYMVSDTLGNGVARTSLLLGLHLTGVLLAAVGTLQVFNAGVLSLPRPVSLLGNSNAFGTLLVVLLPFPLVQGLHRRGVVRALLWGYALVLLGLLFFTNSRGAWVAGGAALLVVAGYALWREGLTTRAALRAWWTARTPLQKAQWVTLGALAAVALLVVLVIFVQSFAVSGRGTDRRTLLWEFAVQMFLEQPITGQGLFTYGYHLPRFWSIPPQQPHSHPHNLPLLLLAELGLLGVVAMGAFVAVLVRVLRRAWRDVPAAQHPTWLASAAALLGFGVHHLFDTTLMLPALAWVGWVLLAVVAVPFATVPMRARWRALGHPVGMLLLWAIVLAAGAWQTARYVRYYNALGAVTIALHSEGIKAMLEPLATLDVLSVEDPHAPAYAHQRGYFYGVIASHMSEYAPQAYQAYQDYVRLEPYDAVAWANLAALACQLGEGALAQTYSAQALALAPDWATIRQQHAHLHGLPNAPTQSFVPQESPYAPNKARYQHWHDVSINEHIPQVGWITSCDISP